MKKLVFLFLTLLVANSVWSQAKGTHAKAVTEVIKPIKFEEYDLANGLHVILYPDHSAPVAYVRVYYHVGSKNERADMTGFAHFFEHLMFEGTDDIKRGEYGKDIEAVGGDLNAHTSLDRTFYNEDVPANDLHMALWMESERMHTLHVDTIGVETQRQVVKEEKRNRYDNQPYGTFFPKMMESVFKTSQYNWTPIGQAQYIDQATIKEFQDFYHKYYVPNNATLVVAGDFETADAKKAVQEYFGWIPRGAEIERNFTPEAPQTSERYTEVDEKITPLPAVAYAWRTVPEGEKDQYALDMLTSIFAQGNSSRLVKRLKDKDQLVVNIEPIVLNLEKEGLFGMLLVANRGVEVAKIRTALDEEIQKLQKEGITEEEYEKVRNQITKLLVEQMAKPGDVAFQLAHQWTLFHNTNRINTEYDRYMAVKKEDIQRVAKKYLTVNTRSVIVYTVPKS